MKQQMTNINFLNYINAKILRHITTNEYVVFVGAIHGYNDDFGYDDGILFKINDELVSDSYSVEDIIQQYTHVEPADEPTDESTDEPADETIDESTDESEDETTDETTDESIETEVEENTNIHVITKEDIENGLLDEYESTSSINFTLYKLKNDILSYQYSESELNDFVTTFMRLISNLGNFSNDNINTNKNQIYRRVINFYANGQSDSTLVNLILLLKSESYNYNDTSTMSVCGCSDSSNSSSTLNSSNDCSTMYQNAMLLYLKQMLADIDFYYDFFHIENEPIEDLIDSLINLINEFKTLGYDLSFSTNKTHCGCSTLSKDNGSCNYNILDNYIRVLNWIKNCEIEENTNKIKIYGEQFAELLPKLQF